jgi:hypothetical protein
MYAPLRRVYNKLLFEFLHLGREMLLQHAVKATNDTQGLNGLVPSMLVFETLPRFPILQSDLPNQRDRLDAIKTAQAERNNIIAEQRIQEAMIRRVTPAADYILKPGQPVRVYREKDEAWLDHSAYARSSVRN